LLDEVEQLQRLEEALLLATGVPREPGAPPWVVLGVEVLGSDRARAA
jgi:hypothetical protein